jgi:2,4-dienoyl-CoA reductase-like NADH-dependent reductase (Old Yellow Enzyme family)
LLKGLPYDALPPPVSAGVYGSRQLTIPSMYVEQGCFVHLAEAVKERVSIPVVAVGRIKSPDMADSIIRNNKADMIALGRSLLADAQWPNKAKISDARCNGRLTVKV